MKFEKEYQIGAREIGTKNKITNYGILALLEDIACLHSDKVGYGVKDIETKNRAWILLDWKLKVFKRPGYGEKVDIKTWARTIEKPQFFTYRDFKVFDKDGNIIAIATSKWVLIDVKKGKIAKLELELMDLYKTESEHVFNEQDVEKLNSTEKVDSQIDYVVRRSDIDVNQHVNNLNYLNYAYEALPEEIYNKEECENVRITYKHQIKLGDTVKFCYSFDNNVNTVVIKSEDEKTIHSIIKLWD